MDLRPSTADFAPNQLIEYTIDLDPTNPNEPAGSYHYQVVDLTTDLDVPGAFGDVDLPVGGDAVVTLAGLPTGRYRLDVTAPPIAGNPGRVTLSGPFTVATPPVTRVSLVREGPISGDLGDICVTYQGFIDFLTTVGPTRTPPFDVQPQVNVGVPAGPHPTPPFGLGPDTYDQLLQLARDYVQTCHCTELALLAPGGYVADREEDARRAGHWTDPAAGIEDVDMPCIELIWNYWEEEGMLVQTLNHIVARFQNRRVSVGDPLARFDVSPLLALRSLLWSWVENEHRRLSVRRRAAEYEFEYGLRLIGRAVPRGEKLYERRSNFLQSFHTILNLSADLFRQIDTLIVNPDGHPLYEALREGHLVLSQGTENQYGEMAVQSRAEMLVMQHILAQPSMREFLGGRPMTPYPEPWMDRVDSMKAIQGWSDASVLHFHDLATFGERLVITIRLGNWAALAVGAAEAVNWVTIFRPVIQRYIAAYRVVTGIDLAAGVDTTMPSTLIADRLGQALRRA